MQRRLAALSTEDSWWDEFPAKEIKTSPRQTRPARWALALCGATALHLVAIGLASLLHRDGVDAPSPGTGAPAIEVVMLPAWPEPGHHPSQLAMANVAATPVPTAPVITPPTLLAATSSAADRISDPASLELASAADETAKTSVVATASEAAAPPEADLPPSTPNAAEALWEGDLLAKLLSLKRYPPGAEHTGQQDTVMVRFVVDRSGQALSAEVIKSKGFALLDREAIALIRRASPLPRPPAEVSGDEIELIVPIQFILHGAR